MSAARKIVAVVAAVIVRDGKFLATQRSGGSLDGGWEFPGGKVEPGETPEEALVREIREELGAEVCPGAFLSRVEHDYDDFHLSMDCFVCSLVSERITLLEHSDARWLDASTIDSVDWLPADVQVVEAIKASGLV